MEPSQNVHRDLSEEIKCFHSQDWTFEGVKTNVGLHSIHPYPARFVPQVPQNLIRIFHPTTGGPILDPFCGSGTTLVECQEAGIPSFGVDLNPIATLISKVKTSPPSQEIGIVASQLVAEAEGSENDDLPNIPRLTHWFTPGASLALTKLTSKLANIPDPEVQDALRVALSRIIVRVSRQESDTRYAAVNRIIEEPDVYRVFIESARTLDEIFRKEHSDMFRKWAPSGVITKDILTVEPDEFPYKFGLIITSPPYPNAYEYWLYHKYRMYWLGEDPLSVRSAEIGARPHYFKRNPETPEDFRRQMSQCFSLFHKITLPSAVVCTVIGRSTIKGKSIDNASILCSAAGENGFQQLASESRRIPNNRKSFNPRHGSINTEALLVFQRQE